MQLIGSLALVLVITVSLVVLWLHRRVVGQVRRLERQLEDQTDKIENELCVIMEGALGLGARLQDLNKEYTELREKQLSLENQNLVNLPHDQAVRMVAQGAGVDELVERCGLPRSEAELLVMLNNNNLNRVAAQEGLQASEQQTPAPQFASRVIDERQNDGVASDPVDFPGSTSGDAAVAEGGGETVGGQRK